MKPRLTRAQRAAYEALQSGRWKTLSAREQTRLARTLSDLSVRGWLAVKPDVYVNPRRMAGVFLCPLDKKDEKPLSEGPFLICCFFSSFWTFT